MIVYFAKRGFEFTVRVYFETWGRDLTAGLEVVRYEELPDRRALPAGTYVFADLERLEPAERAMAGELRRQLASSVPAERLLNDPARTLRRYELLELLADRGINRFRAHRLSESLELPAAPSFLRDEAQHVGPLSPVLRDRRDLERALARAFWFGHDPAQLLLVEFCDTRGPDDVYRKYSAFVVGDRILPREVEFSHRWHQQDIDLVDPRFVVEERTYLEANPHAALLLEIARLAGIDYGRFDYGLRDGGIQVWEVNTNPIVARAPADYAPAHVDNHRFFAAGIGRAFEAIDAGHGEPDVAIQLPRARPRRRRTLTRLHQAAGLRAHWYYDGRAGRPLRAVERALLRFPGPATAIMRRRLRRVAAGGRTVP